MVPTTTLRATEGEIEQSCFVVFCRRTWLLVQIELRQRQQRRSWVNSWAYKIRTTSNLRWVCKWTRPSLLPQSRRAPLNCNRQWDGCTTRRFGSIPPSVPPVRGFRDSARFQARRWVFGDIKQGSMRKLPPLSCETRWRDTTQRFGLVPPSVPPARGFRDSARFQARRWVFGDIKQGYIRKLPPLSCETRWREPLGLKKLFNAKGHDDVSWEVWEALANYGKLTSRPWFITMTNRRDKNKSSIDVVKVSILASAWHPASGSVHRIDSESSSTDQRSSKARASCPRRACRWRASSLSFTFRQSISLTRDHRSHRGRELAIHPEASVTIVEPTSQWWSKPDERPSRQ